MSNYPRKIRARQLRGKWVLEELAPSAGGSYFVKRRIVTDSEDIFEVLASDKWLPVILAPEVVEPPIT